MLGDVAWLSIFLLFACLFLFQLFIFSKAHAIQHQKSETEVYWSYLLLTILDTFLSL